MPLYSTDESSRVSSYGGMLPRTGATRMAKPTLPRFRWPSERHLTPAHCANCGARLIVGEIPTGTYQVVDVGCLLCPVVSCELVADGWRAPLTTAEHRALPANQPKPGRPRKLVIGGGAG